jgi:hypothetical protein
MLISHAPTMSWSSILAQYATMNDERLGENRHHQAWWSVGPFGWLPPSLPVCILFLDQSFVRPISPDGVPCGAILHHRHEARRMQYRFRKSPERYLAALEEKLIKERLPT